MIGRDSEMRADQSAGPGYIQAYCLAPGPVHSGSPHTLDLKAAWSNIAHVFRWLTVDRGLGRSVTCTEPASLFVSHLLCFFTRRLKPRGSKEALPHLNLEPLIRLRGPRAPVGRGAGWGSHSNGLVVL